jgi:hypothetical protein
MFTLGGLEIKVHVAKERMTKDVLCPKKLETKLKNAQGSRDEVKFVSGGGQHSSVVIATGSKGFH